MIPRYGAFSRDHNDTFDHNDHKRDRAFRRPYVRPRFAAECREWRDERSFFK
jgi:hypothetical protein